MLIIKNTTLCLGIMTLSTVEADQFSVFIQKEKESTVSKTAVVLRPGEEEFTLDLELT
jgi:hypothetical protein